MKFLLLNGPPGAGKDAFAAEVKRHFQHRVGVEKFSAPLKKGLAGVFALTPEQLAEVEASKEAKAVPRSYLLGMTWRDAQIWLSEKVMKPTFGNQVFGDLLVQRLRRGSCGPGVELVVISDSGFSEEAEVLRQAFGVENIHVIELHRPGHDFLGDSRSYWSDGAKLRWQRQEVHNSGGLHHLHQSALAIVRTVMGW